MAGGIRSAQEGRASDRAAVVVVLATAVRDVKTAVEAIKRGAYDYITKPFDVDAIVLLVDRALEKRPSRGRCCACGRSLPFPASTTGWRAHRRSPPDAANLPGHSPSGGGPPRRGPLPGEAEPPRLPTPPWPAPPPP